MIIQLVNLSFAIEISTSVLTSYTAVMRMLKVTNDKNCKGSVMR